MTDFTMQKGDDGVAVITINRPEAKNAVNLEVSEGIAAAIDELESRDDLTIGIITGAIGLAIAVIYWILVAAGVIDINAYSDMS